MSLTDEQCQTMRLWADRKAVEQIDALRELYATQWALLELCNIPISYDENEQERNKTALKNAGEIYLQAYSRAKEIGAL